MSANLPDVSRSERMGGRGAQTVRFGSWWRLAGSSDEIASMKLRPGALPPEDPITLLVTDVRIHDGEMHSVRMAYHPAWGNGTIAVMADDFLINFVEVDVAEAEARREREIAALMGRTAEISMLIRSGPPQEDILRISSEISERKTAEAEEAEARRLKEAAQKDARRRARKEGLSYHETERACQEAWRSVPDRVPVARSSGGMVPAALLPSGDVVAVQNRISAEITRMEAVQKWISARADEMNQTMGVVAAYQTEKVNAMTSGISEKTKQAEGMLKNVATMKLFLGDDIDLWKVSEGDGAEPVSRLHLMQSMLYLDEEILVEGLFGKGLRHKDLSRLPELLADNPELVRRMMPHDRCVAIAKVRRHSVNLNVPEGVPFGDAFNAVMMQISEIEADKRIFILIRDGENVTVVIADENTSAAERLFPSRAEIDKIYTGAFDRREITPQDIEYSDKRNAHDSRALFYKRFLIILWGLHEREGVFGDFMPKGMNWLEESVTSDSFVFVHDEENVLESGREGVHEYICRGLSDLRPGSEVMIDTKLAFSEEFAPTAYRESNIRDKWTKDRVRSPKDAYLRAAVAKSGDNLMVQVPTLAGYSDREVNTPMIVRTEDGKSPDGVLNLGGATSAKLKEYMNSRLERRSYLAWFGMFSAALPALEEREREQADVMRRVMAAGDVSEEDATRSISLFREAVKGGRLPQNDGEIARVVLNARSIADPAKFDKDGVIGVRMHAGGKVSRLYAAPERAPGVAVRELIQERDGERSRVPFSMISPRGESLVLGRDRMREHLGKVDAKAIPGLSTLQDWEAAEFDPSEALVSLSPSEVTEEAALKACQDFLDLNNSSKSRSVAFVSKFLPVGVISFPQRVWKEDRWDRKVPASTELYGVIESPLTSIFLSGHEDIVRATVRRICDRENTERVISRVRSKEPLRFAYGSVNENAPMSRVISGPSDAFGFYPLSKPSGDSAEIAKAHGDPVLEIFLSSYTRDDVKKILMEEGRSPLVTFSEDALVQVWEHFHGTRPESECPDLGRPS